MPNKQAYHECWNECSNPTIYTHQNVHLCALSWEEEQMHRKIREQSALKPEDTIFLYSPGIRRLVKVNWIGEERTFPHWYLRTSGRKACQYLGDSATGQHSCQPAPGRKRCPNPPGAWSWQRTWPVTTGTPQRPSAHTHTQPTTAKEIHLELKLYLKPSKRQWSTQSWGQFQIQPYQHFLWNDNQEWRDVSKELYSAEQKHFSTSKVTS